MPEQFTFRFLLFPKDSTFQRSFPGDMTFGQVREELRLNWPSELDPLKDEEEVRFIFGGRLTKDSTLVSQVAKPDDVMSLHIIKRPRQQPQGSGPVLGNKRNFSSASKANNINNNNTQQKGDVTLPSPNEEMQPQIDPEFDSKIHFHGLFFNEEEVEELKTIFEKKSDPKKPSMIKVVETARFLQHYCTWTQRAHPNQKHNKTYEFSTPAFKQLVSRVQQGRTRDLGHLSFLEFASLFFLWDNTASHEQCVHGHKERVQRATQELHKSLSEEQFDDKLFDSVITSISPEQQKPLTCQEVELTYYVYALRLTILQ